MWTFISAADRLSINGESVPFKVTVKPRPTSEDDTTIGVDHTVYTGNFYNLDN